jgi:hypothetical protein
MRLVKLPDNSWVNPEEVVRIIETEQKTIQVRLANDEWIDIKGHNIDQVASVFLTPVFAVIDDDLIVNKNHVESVHISTQDLDDSSDPRVFTELRMVSGRVLVTNIDIDEVLNQLDGIPFFREVE